LKRLTTSAWSRKIVVALEVVAINRGIRRRGGRINNGSSSSEKEETESGDLRRVSKHDFVSVTMVL
jgi:hypothetical protein